MGETRTAASGATVAVCACCGNCADRPLMWEIVTCPECGAPCSCVGCVAEVEARALFEKGERDGE